MAIFSDVPAAPRNRFLNNLPWLVFLGSAWGLGLTLVGALTEPTPENWTLMASIWFAGLYTLGLRFTRDWWLPILAKRPLRNAVLLGAFNAAVIETEFLVFEKFFGAEGVAAHPNLLVDLVMTMPWYILMCLTFVKVQHRWRFSTPVVLLLGALYELGADGIVSSLVGLPFGNFQLFRLEYWLMMGLMFFWAFIPVYVSMVLAPAWLVAKKPRPERPATSPWRDALKPLLWLPPFTLYLYALMFLILAFSGG